MKIITSLKALLTGTSSAVLFCSKITVIAICFFSMIFYVPDVGYMHPDKVNQIIQSMKSRQFEDAVLANIAVSVPVAAEFLLDIATSILTTKGLSATTMRSYLPRVTLVSSLVIPGLLMRFVAFPTNNANLSICIFITRLAAIMYAVLGHLWEEGGTYFRSIWFILGAMLVNVALLLACWDCLCSSNKATVLMDISNGLFGASMGVLSIVMLPWLKNMKNLGINNMSSSQISCTAYVLLVGVFSGYVFITTIMAKESMDYLNAQYLSAYMYVEAGFTIILSLLYTRLAHHEVLMKENILDLKRNFVRFVSHEIRTPLNAVKLGLLLIKRGIDQGEDADEILKTLDEVECACGVSLDILNDLLSYEKLEAGIMTLEKVEVNAWTFLMTTVRPFVMQARQMEISLELPNESDSDTNINNNNNILHNTTLYIDTNQYIIDRVSLKDGGASKKQKLLRIQVKDFGAGISKDIVQLHQGRIGVTSEGEGTGCTFYLDIPIREGGGDGDGEENLVFSPSISRVKLSVLLRKSVSARGVSLAITPMTLDSMPTVSTTVKLR
eukprot:gene11190-23377_t